MLIRPFNYVTSASYFMNENSHAHPIFEPKIILVPILRSLQKIYHINQERLNYLIKKKNGYPKISFQ